MNESKINVSIYNHTIEGFDPKKFIINDVTLREGEQAANGGLNLEQKLEITRMLDDFGIQQVQGGYPGRSEIDKIFLQNIKKEGLKIKTEALIQIFTDDWKEQIDIAIDTGADVIGMMHPSSDMRLEYMKITRKQMVEHITKAIKYVKDKFECIRFSTTDSTRTEISFLKDVYGAAIEAGANRILITDTTGSTTPECFYSLVKEIVDTFPVHVAIHCHNDFGLALANALAGIRAGATIVDASVNGIGDRTGNPSIAELVASMKFLYRLDVPYHLEKMCKLSRLIEKITGVKIPGEKPLVGQFAFAHKLDAHVKGVYYNSALYEPIDPELVGNKRRILIGKYTGPFVIKTKLQELKIKGIPDKKINEIISSIENLSIKLRRSLTDDEFINIIEKFRE